MLTHESVNQAIETLWKDECQKGGGLKLWPLAVNAIKTKSILFIGLNPSFSDKGWKTINGNKFDANEFYEWGGGKYSREEDIKLEERARETYSYYAKFRNIAGQLKFGDRWEHIDLFFVRETSQNKLKELLSSGATDGSLNEFANKQLIQSKALIEASEPLVIVVANAYASGIYRKIFKSELECSRFDDLGYHYTCLNKRHVPTFFTSMLTQQRALDNGSFERLQWQIGQAIKRSSAQECCGKS